MALCNALLLLLSAAALVVAGGVRGGVRVYDGAEIDVTKLLRSRVSMTAHVHPAPGEAPLADADKSWMNLTLDFSKSDAGVSRAHILLFHAGLRPYMGYNITEGGAKHLCCQREHAAAGHCIMSPNPVIDVRKLPVHVDASRPSADHFYSHAVPASLFAQPVERSHEITLSGFWYLYVLNCHENATLSISGTTTWRNYYGYLPASIYAWMPVYLLLTIVYVIATTLFGALIFIHRATPLKIQYLIFIVLFVSMVEKFVFALDWTVYNYATGSIDVGFNVVSVFFYAARSVLSFSLLLIVAMGWQVYRPSLAPMWRRLVIGYTLLTFCCTLIAEFVLMLGYTPQLQHLAAPSWLQTLLLVPVTFLEFGFVAWTFFELVRTLYVLEKHKQTVKLAMFRRLALCLFIYTAIAVMLFLFEVGFQFGGLQERYYAGWWVFSASWPLLFCAALLTVAVLFRPSARNTELRMVQLPTDASAGADVELDARDDAAADDAQRDVSEGGGGGGGTAAGGGGGGGGGDDDDGSYSYSYDDEDEDGDGDAEQVTAEAPAAKASAKAAKAKADKAADKSKNKAGGSAGAARGKRRGKQ